MRNNSLEAGTGVSLIGAQTVPLGRWEKVFWARGGGEGGGEEKQVADFLGVNFATRQALSGASSPLVPPPRASPVTSGA